MVYKTHYHTAAELRYLADLLDKLNTDDCREQFFEGAEGIKLKFRVGGDCQYYAGDVEIFDGTEWMYLPRIWEEGEGG